MDRAGGSVSPSRKAPLALFALLLAVPLLVTALDPSVAVTQYASQRWTYKEGLPASDVEALAQTPDGYIWVGTAEGLVRFDGERFAVFTPGNSDGLASGYITALLVSGDGALWIGTANGLSVYKGGAFRKYTAAEGLAHDVVLSLEADADGAVWIGTNGGGLCRFKEGHFRTWGTAEGLLSGIVHTLFMDGAGRLWIGTATGTNLLQGTALTAFSREARIVRGAAAGRPRAKMPPSFQADEGLTVLEGATLRPLAPYEDVSCLLLDSDGNTWVATGSKGLYRVTGSGAGLYRPADLKGKFSVNALLEDREGGLWIGSAEGLLHLSNPSVIPFGLPEGQPIDVVYSVCEGPGGVLWIGGEGGLASRKNGVFHSFPAKGRLSDSLVTCVLQDPKGPVWIGTAGGLDLLEGDRITRGFLNRQIPSPFAISLCRDQAGAVWMGTRGEGLFRISAGKVDHFTSQDGLTDNYPGALCPSRDGTLWVGGTAGLNRLDPATRKVQTFTTREGLAANYVLSLYEDERGALWAGSWGGLTRVRDGRLRALTPRQGLPSEVIYQILPDGAGRLWMSSPQGLFAARAADLEALSDGKASRIRFAEFGEREGMRSSRCNGTTQPAGCRTAAGQLWFATPDGVLLVDPPRTAPGQGFPPVLIESVTVDGTGYSSAKPLVAPPGRRKMEVTFAAPSFRNPEKVRCRYRLEGFDQGWTEVDTRRSAYYTNLPKGQFVFRVSACNEAGEWNPVGAALKVTLMPYFYETWWFLFLCAAGAVTIAGGSVQWRFRRLEAHERELQALVAERTAQLAAANRELERLANEDGLTRIPNIRHFRGCLDGEWRRAVRNCKPLSVILMDVDHFKAFNDRYGHPAGDECLKGVAGVLRERLRRAGDAVGRYGGEEFIVLCANADAAGAAVVARDLRRGVEALGIPHEGSDAAPVVTISLGCATAMPREGEDPAGLIAAADHALYKSKSEGRNRITSVDLSEVPRDGENRS